MGSACPGQKPGTRQVGQAGAAGCGGGARPTAAGTAAVVRWNGSPPVARLGRTAIAGHGCGEELPVGQFSVSRETPALRRVRGGGPSLIPARWWTCEVPRETSLAPCPLCHRHEVRLDWWCVCRPGTGARALTEIGSRIAGRCICQGESIGAPSRCRSRCGLPRRTPPAANRRPPGGPRFTWNASRSWPAVRGDRTCCSQDSARP